MSTTSIGCLRNWLQRQLPEAAWQWLDGQLAKLASDPSDKVLHVTLGMIPRKFGKDDLQLDDNDINSAQTARDGWRPQTWSVDTAARVLTLCELAERDAATDGQFAERFTELCRYADVAEQAALYRGLPVYPDPETLETQTAEGLRTNMRAVFESIAHHSPYPREMFNQNRWNQMVLKALFVDSRLWPIQGLDERANQELAKILCDYAHERWAAGREVTVELWRCVGSFAEGDMISDLERVISSDSVLERQAGALALSACNDPSAKDLLAKVPELADDISNGNLSWDTISTNLAD